MPDKAKFALVINYHDQFNKIKIFIFYMLEIRSDNHYFLKGLLNFFHIQSLSLGMARKIPTEDYCADTSMYSKLFNALIELIFQFKKPTNSKNLLVQKMNFKA